jgi:hypothetical protein
MVSVMLMASATPARAQGQYCTRSPFGAEICVDKPVQVSGGDRGGGSDGSDRGGNDGGGGGGGGTVRVDPRRSQAIQAAESLESTADEALARGEYERSIELYRQALRAYYTRDRQQFYEGEQHRARRAWFDSTMREIDAARTLGRYQEVPRLLDDAKRIWYSRSLQQYIDGWKRFLKEHEESERVARRRNEEAADNATRAERALRSGDMKAVARLLGEGIDVFGATPPNNVENSVVHVSTRALGQDGVAAFAQAHEGYRLYDGRTTQMFRGSAAVDQRYARLRDGASRVPDRIQGLATDDRRALTVLVDFARALPAQLDELRRNDSPGTARRIADDFRQAVLLAAHRARIAPGEDDRITLALIREAQQHCVSTGDRSPYCAAGRASVLKGIGDPSKYPARRNAEHYLFAKEMTEHLGPIYGASALAGSPLWSLMKAVWPGDRFAGSPGTVHEAGWGQLGAVVGLTGKLDPTLRK